MSKYGKFLILGDFKIQVFCLAQQVVTDFMDL